MSTAASAADAPVSTDLISMDPATGQEVGRVPRTPIEAIPKLVFAAHQAQRGWGALTHAQRAQVLRPAAARLKAEARRLGELASREMGKPLAEAVGEANYCADGFGAELDEIVAALADAVREDKRVTSILRHAPLGVCAAITPWNFPNAMIARKVAPALAAGCGFVCALPQKRRCRPLRWLFWRNVLAYRVVCFRSSPLAGRPTSAKSSARTLPCAN